MENKKYIAMNRFKIVKGKEDIFEKIWKERDSKLSEVKGFINFNLIKGKVCDDFTLYASHSTWSSEIDFLNWTRSDSFREAHKNAGQNREIYLGHPEFEGFLVVL